MNKQYRKKRVIMMKHYLNMAGERQELTKAEDREAMDVITDGRAEEFQIAASISEKKIKGGKPEKIVGLAQAPAAVSRRRAC